MAQFSTGVDNVIRQRAKEDVAAARIRGCKGGRPRRMTPERLRYAQHLLADRSRSIPVICRELGGVPANTLYHYLHADGTLKAPGLKLLSTAPEAAAAAGERPGTAA